MPNDKLQAATSEHQRIRNIVDVCGSLHGTHGERAQEQNRQKILEYAMRHDLPVVEGEYWAAEIHGRNIVYRRVA